MLDDMEKHIKAHQDAMIQELKRGKGTGRHWDTMIMDDIESGPNGPNERPLCWSPPVTGPHPITEVSMHEVGCQCFGCIDRGVEPHTFKQDCRICIMIEQGRRANYAYGVDKHASSCPCYLCKPVKTDLAPNLDHYMRDCPRQRRFLIDAPTIGAMCMSINNEGYKFRMVGDMPDTDFRVTRLALDPLSDRITIVIECQAFEPVPPGQEIPYGGTIDVIKV